MKLALVEMRPQIIIKIAMRLVLYTRTIHKMRATVRQRLKKSKRYKLYARSE